MTDDWDGLYWQAMLRQAQWEDRQRQRRVSRFRRRALVAFVFALVVILFCIALTPARAAYGTPQERAVCMPDFKRLCPRCPHLNDNSSTALVWLCGLCVKVNRSQFGRGCSAVLERHGL